jgi:hypothetical protein
MSAQFVSLAVGYALGGGTLRRKGSRQRPWLELRRLETEATYLGHQVRALQRAGGGSVRVDLDVIAGPGLYDLRRARLHSPLLERVMAIAAPDGLQTITPTALEVAGQRGLALLWLDRGRWEGPSALLPLRHSSETDLVRQALRDLSIPSAPYPARPDCLRIAAGPMEALAQVLRPHVHRSMRHALRPGSHHGLTLVNGK